MRVNEQEHREKCESNESKKIENMAKNRYRDILPCEIRSNVIEIAVKMTTLATY